MSVAAKLYANKAGKAEGKPNRAQVTMNADELKAVGQGDKAVLKEVIAAAKAATS